MNENIKIYDNITRIKENDMIEYKIQIKLSEKEIP